MTRDVADRAGLTVRTNLMLALKAVSGERRRFDRACEDIEINIGNIANTQMVLVVDNIDHQLILGCPFFHDAKLTFEYDEDGYQCARFWNESRSKVGTTRVCNPQGKSWREARIREESENE